MRSRLFVTVTLALALLTSMVYAQTPRPSTGSPQVLARINKFNVTWPYFNYIVEGRFAREILDSIIRSRVIEDEARAQGVTISQEAVTALLDTQKKSYASEEDFDYHLQEMGYTLKAYREHLRQQLMVSALMEKDSVVSDAAAKAYYDAHKADFAAQTEIHLQVIPTGSQQDALVAYRTLLEGTPWDAVARRYGVQPLPGKGGDLGWVSAATCPIAGLWEQAAALKVKDVSTPFELDGKAYLALVSERREAGTQPFEAVKSDIKLRLREDKGVSEADYVQSLVAKADIRIPWPTLSYLEKEYRATKGLRVAVDGKVLRLTPEPIVAADGVMLVPAKPVLQAIGATLVWHSGAKILEVTRGQATVKISIGERMANVNGQLKDMKTAAAIQDNVLYIPPRAVLPELGVSVEYNALARLLSVSTVSAKQP
jgi:parvulin-like peptidyl-prolyl isomerase